MDRTGEQSHIPIAGRVYRSILGIVGAATAAPELASRGDDHDDDDDGGDDDEIPPAISRPSSSSPSTTAATTSAGSSSRSHPRAASHGEDASPSHRECEDGGGVGDSPVIRISFRQQRRRRWWRRR